jgi:hypothetical protein
MNSMSAPAAPAGPRSRRGLALAVFAAVLAAQLLLVALAGTDVPFQDQWDIEGRWLYPAWRDGTLRFADLAHPLNEHRIAWTHALNVALFAVDGQWDPLVQLVAIAGLRAACAGLLAWIVLGNSSRRAQPLVALVVGAAFLPHLAWHNAIWGNQSQVLFALGWSLLAAWCLAPDGRSTRRTIAGVATGLAGLGAMAPAGMLPVALIAMAALRAQERGQWGWPFGRELVPAAALLLAAWLLRVSVPEHASLHAQSFPQGWAALLRGCAWPHPGGLMTALAMNAPILALVALRATRRRTPVAGEDFVLTMAAWSTGLNLAAAWARGGGAELAAGVPSRYVDFVVLLPLANLWCAVVLTAPLAARWAAARWVTTAWIAFGGIGWLGLSAEVLRGVVIPRARDRDAPVRLLQAFQASHDPAVFAGQPRLLVPHPHPESIRAVLADPRLRGALPPSLQPEAPMGPLSRVVRPVLGR